MVIEGKQVYGVPGRDLHHGESLGQAIKRNIQEEIGYDVDSYEIISVNSNYAFNNHYIGIGAIAKITGDVKLLHPKDWETWSWFALDNIPDNLFPPARNVIESYKQKKVTVSE